MLLYKILTSCMNLHLNVQINTDQQKYKEFLSPTHKKGIVHFGLLVL